MNTYAWATLSDAFGRLRTSQPFTLFDSFHRYADNGKLVEFTQGTASSSHDALSSSIVMTIGSNQGDKIYRESSKVFAYQPGKSLLTLQSFCMAPAKDGLRQRIGYYDKDNGMYLQLLGNVVSFVRRSSVSGQVVETVIPQSDWNYDKMNGRGPSGYVLDISKTQILFIDIEWLGVGSVRIGFVTNGKFNICHEFHHANLPSSEQINTSLPYMSTACLPVRAELENVGNTSGSQSFRIICTSIMSEGGYEFRGKMVCAHTGPPNVPIVLPTANAIYPVISIRLKTTHMGAIVIPKQLQLVPVDAGDYQWCIVVNATLTGGNGWVSARADSAVEYNIGSTNIITNGTIMRVGYFAASKESPIITFDKDVFAFQLERNTFTNTPFPFTIAVASTNASSRVLASINWDEIT